MKISEDKVDFILLILRRCSQSEHTEQHESVDREMAGFIGIAGTGNTFKLAAATTTAKNTLHCSHQRGLKVRAEIALESGDGQRSLAYYEIIL